MHGLHSRVVVQHHHAAKLLECVRIAGGADRRVVAQQPIEYFGIEQPHSTDRCEPDDLAIDRVEIAHRPGRRNTAVHPYEL